MCEFDEMTQADKNEYNRREQDEQEDVCVDCGQPTDSLDEEYCMECQIAIAETAMESRMER